MTAFTPRNSAGRADESVEIVLFAGMAAAAGRRSLVLPWCEETAAGLRARLAEACPAIEELVSRSAVAIGDAYVPDAAAVPRGAIVAIIPPVSGG